MLCWTVCCLSYDFHAFRILDVLSLLRNLYIVHHVNFFEVERYLIFVESEGDSPNPNKCLFVREPPDGCEKIKTFDDAQR